MLDICRILFGIVFKVVDGLTNDWEKLDLIKTLSKQQNLNN